MTPSTRSSSRKLDARKGWRFDSTWTKDITVARQIFLRTFLADLRSQMTLESAVDVGCGVGEFSKLLFDLGFRVVGIEGRKENTEEAKKRYPEIEFVFHDAEELDSRLGMFDLVLCPGLLYHLENPFRVIRNLFTLTGKMLIIESMCIPDRNPTMYLFDEHVAEDQGLKYVAFYASEACLVKMMYRAGFANVYKAKQLPAHTLYSGTIWRKRVRTVLVGSHTALVSSQVVRQSEPRNFVPDTRNNLAYGKWNPWSTYFSRLYHLPKSSLASFRAFASRTLKPLRKTSSQPDD